MNFLTGITNLTSWMGNVIMPTLAALFFALGVLRYAHGQAHTYAPWAGFLCLMVSGVLRGIEKFAAQAAWNNPDLVWITMRGMVNWSCNVFLPVYAVLMLFKYGKPGGYLKDLFAWHTKPRIYCGLEPDSGMKLDYFKEEETDAGDHRSA